MSDAAMAVLERPDETTAGTIDCDTHPVVPGLRALLPYMDDYWRDVIVQREIHELDPVTYPVNSPLSCRPDWKGTDLAHAAGVEQFCRQALDELGSSTAICNCLYGIQLLHSEDMAAAYAGAVNQWLKAEWLAKDRRLRGSIVVPMQSPQLSAAEIERHAGDRRFVQVLMLVMGDMPLGKRFYWPIYEAAAKHGLPVAIHAGSMYRHPVTGIGWPSFHTQDYFSQASAFQTQLTSLITEGVFARYPTLKVVLCEAGISWLPSYLWRLDKHWTGLRVEIPWVDRPPSRIVAENVRFTLQPFDAPEDAGTIERLFEHIGNDDLILFSSDYPHWQFDDEIMPRGLSAATERKIRVDNPRATYSRLV